MAAKPFVGSADGMYREEVAVWALQDKKTLQPIPGLFYRGSTQQYIAVDGCAVTYEQVSVKATRSGTRWMLVYFDLDGSRVGAGCFPNKGYAVTKSCWGSFLKKKL